MSFVGKDIVGIDIYNMSVYLIQNKCLPIMDGEPIDLIGYFDPNGNPHLFPGKHCSTTLEKLPPERIKQMISSNPFV